MTKFPFFSFLALSALLYSPLAYAEEQIGGVVYDENGNIISENATEATDVQHQSNTEYQNDEPETKFGTIGSVNLDKVTNNIGSLMGTAGESVTEQIRPEASDNGRAKMRDHKEDY